MPVVGRRTEDIAQSGRRVRFRLKLVSLPHAFSYNPGRQFALPGFYSQKPLITGAGEESGYQSGRVQDDAGNSETRGQQARTVVPSPGLAVISKLPPNISTLSLMPARPRLLAVLL